MKSRKNKGYKIQSYSRIFDSSSRRKKKQIKNIVLSVVVILLLVFVGYSISGPLSNLLRGEKTQIGSSSSEKTDSSQIISSQISSNEKEEISKPQALKAAFLPISTAQNPELLSSYIEKIKGLGYNSAVLTLKDEDGKIFYATQNTMAQSVGAVSESPVDLNSIVSKLKEQNIVPIAHINAFKDKIATKNSAAKILYSKQEGWSWFDAANGKPWLNPYSSEAQSYITALSCELAELGFENVMVSSIMFPSVNSFTNADFGELEKTVSHADILSQYTKTLKGALNAKNAKLLLCYNANQAQNPENVIYGKGDPKKFSYDVLVPEIFFAEDSASELSALVASLKTENPDISVMPKFETKTVQGIDFTKEEIDAHKAVVKDVSVYAFKSDGNYIG